MDSLTGVASDNVRSTPQSRPFLGQTLRSANDPKRTFNQGFFVGRETDEPALKRVFNIDPPTSPKRHHAEGKAPTAERTVNPAGAAWRA